MALPLPPDVVANMLCLRRSGISVREIARRLGVHRETVGKYLVRFEREAPNCDGEPLAIDSKVARPSTQRKGLPSRCAPYREVILEKISLGLTAQKIYEHLVREHGFTGRYYSVRRFVAKLLDRTKESSDVIPAPPSTSSDSFR